MTPEREQELLDAADAKIDKASADAYAKFQATRASLGTMRAAAEALAEFNAVGMQVFAETMEAIAKEDGSGDATPIVADAKLIDERLAMFRDYIPPVLKGLEQQSEQQFDAARAAADKLLREYKP